MSAETTTAKTPQTALKSNLRGQFAMLLIQFLFGMAVTLIGTPSETQGFARIGSSILLGLHVLVAIGLLVGAIRAIAQASRIGSRERSLAWISAVAVVITFGAGVLSLSSGSGWWTYLMGFGATTTLLTYGLMYLRAVGREGSGANDEVGA